MRNRYITSQLGLDPYDPLSVKEIKIEMWGYRFILSGEYFLPTEEWRPYEIRCIGCDNINIKHTLPRVDERLNEVEIFDSSVENDQNGVIIRLYLEATDIEIHCAEVRIEHQEK